MNTGLTEFAYKQQSMASTNPAFVIYADPDAVLRPFANTDSDEEDAYDPETANCRYRHVYGFLCSLIGPCTVLTDYPWLVVGDVTVCSCMVSDTVFLLGPLKRISVL